MILAGDIGGTSTRLALFDDDAREQLALDLYNSRQHSGLANMAVHFLHRHGADVAAASFAVAGPVVANRAALTNLPWPVDGARLAGALRLPRVSLLNDLEANARGIETLGDDDFAVLNEGDLAAGGNAAVISAGTGLGQAGLYWDGGRHHPFATEGGHADFAALDDVQAELRRVLAADFGRVSYERVCSGMGLANIYRFLTGAERDPAAISGDALEGTDEAAVKALDLMVDIYGAQAGNLALTMMATGGIYLGGGIAPKILPKLEDGAFMRAFVDKGRLSPLLERIPVRVILNDKTALLGAALAARDLLASSS